MLIIIWVLCESIKTGKPPSLKQSFTAICKTQLMERDELKLVLLHCNQINSRKMYVTRMYHYSFSLHECQARNQDFLWGGANEAKVDHFYRNLFCYCLIRVFRKVAIHEKLQRQSTG